MVELIILSALGVITFFSGLISLGNQEVFMGALTFLVLLVSYVLIVLVYRKKKKLKLAKEVIYTGYEKYLYGVSYIVLCVTCLLIYLEMVQIVSMTSPILMVSWLVPLIDYLAYESLLVFNKHEMILNGENISYKSIRAVKLMDKQKKYKIVIRAKGKEYLYKTNEKNSQKVFDYLNKVCPRIDHREKL